MNSSLNRRSFLRTSSALITLAALSPGSVFAAEQPKRTLKKGYMLNAFPPLKKASLLDKFKMVKAAGFDGVEPNSSLDRDEILKAQQATGLEVASISCGDHTRMFADQAPPRRQQGVEGLIRAVETAHAAGAKSVLVVAGGVNENVSYTDNYKRTQECIRKVLPVAEKAGVVLAIENVWNNFLQSPLEAVRYIEEFKSPYVGWHFDAGNVMNIGWPEQWIHILGKHIQKVHIKEFSREKMNKEGMRKGFSVEYLQGDNRWPVVMKALDDVNYKGWAIVEPACGECKQKLEPEAYLKKVSEELDQIIAS